MPGYPRAGGGINKLLIDRKKDRLNERKKNKSHTAPIPAKLRKKKRT